MLILLSNDDSVNAPALKILQKELKKIARVVVVAPLEEKSTTGHSLTIHKPLRVLEMDEDFYGTNGSPADCVYLGVKQVLKKKPDFVVSGPNRGANLGQDIFYSGTVSAAREATMMGIRSVAVSLAIDFKSKKLEKDMNYHSAAILTRKLLPMIPKWKSPVHTLYNLNVPDLPLSRIKGIKLAPQGFRHYSGSVLRRKDHRGRNYYWVGGEYEGFRESEDSDCAVVHNGFAALTPMQLDVTHYEHMRELETMMGNVLKV